MPNWSDIETINYNDDDIYIVYLNDDEVWRKEFNDITITLDDTISKVDCLIYNQNNTYIKTQKLEKSGTLTIKYGYIIKLQITPKYEKPYTNVSEKYKIEINDDKYLCDTNKCYEKDITISKDIKLVISAAPNDINKAAELVMQYFYMQQELKEGDPVVDSEGNPVLKGLITTSSGAFYDGLTYTLHNENNNTVVCECNRISDNTLKLSKTEFNNISVLPSLSINDTKYNLTVKYQPSNDDTLGDYQSMYIRDKLKENFDGCPINIIGPKTTNDNIHIKMPLLMGDDSSRCISMTMMVRTNSYIEYGTMVTENSSTDGCYYIGVPSDSEYLDESKYIVGVKTLSGTYTADKLKFTKYQDVLILKAPLSHTTYSSSSTPFSAGNTTLSNKEVLVDIKSTNAYSADYKSSDNLFITFVVGTIDSIDNSYINYKSKNYKFIKYNKANNSFSWDTDYIYAYKLTFEITCKADCEITNITDLLDHMVIST